MHFYCTDTAALRCQPSSPRTSTPSSRPPPVLDSPGGAARAAGSPRRRPGRGPPRPDQPPPRPSGPARLSQARALPSVPSCPGAPPGARPASPCVTPLVSSSTHRPPLGSNLPPSPGTFLRAVDSLLIRLASNFGSSCLSFPIHWDYSFTSHHVPGTDLKTTWTQVVLIITL
ncbi:uncharacterized protein LOC144378569 [Ictidomys tridecemlineatus]